MKKFTLFLVVLLLLSCNTTPKENKINPADKPTTTYSGPIIDMHIHAFADGNPLIGFEHPETLRGEVYEGVKSAAEQKDKTLEAFQTHKIVMAVVTNGQSWGEDFSGEILIGAANRDVESLRKQFEEGHLQVMAEMAPFYGGVLADDPSQIPYFALAEELDIPVGFHIFPGGPNYGIHLMPEMLGAMRTYNANPQQLEDVLVAFPNLRLYIMHGGWPYVEDVKALMYAHPNVYVDIAVVNWILPQEEFNKYLRTLIDAGFGDRIMYGTDQMAWPQVISTGIESVNNAGFLTLEQKSAIFYDNAARFLRLTEEEIQKHKSR
ncbi:amidohydrolase family protein [Muriicola marianensis]|uniref:Metal-dependent hydrolase n=1 Tax=Muriicola marianensis TaxID=1324801 RepID=A0ABQ1QW37_9FLAO|nr:amidohydrolase family protein [Muriicola marianensis]GGD49180.1 metal-dependent hydrolase [Muriicola marianensis]